MDDAGQTAHDTAEAVVERHRYAEPVSLGHLHGVADVPRVGEEVVVSQHRAFGVSGGARGVLDVDDVVGMALVLMRAQLLMADAVGAFGQVSPTPHSVGGICIRLILGRDENHVAEGWECRAGQLAGVRITKFRYEFVDHRHIVGCAESPDDHQGVQLSLGDQVGQFVSTIGRVDRHEDSTNFCSGVLGQQPLGVVGCPDADVLAL